MSVWCPLEDWLTSSSLRWPLIGACGSRGKGRGQTGKTGFMGLDLLKKACKLLVRCGCFFHSTGKEGKVGQLG